MLSEVLRAGHEPTAGLFHLSTPDSILMSYQKSKYSGVEELGAFTQIGAKSVNCLSAASGTEARAEAVVRRISATVMMLTPVCGPR